MSAPAPGESAAEEVKWTSELEVELFHSMYKLKPAGLNKHFYMACIQHHLQKKTGIMLTAQQIWQHLWTLYDLEQVDDFEYAAFPIEKMDFSLPKYLLTGELADGSSATSGSTAAQSLSSSAAQKGAAAAAETLTPTTTSGGGGSIRSRAHSTSTSPASSPLYRPPSKRRK